MQAVTWAQTGINVLCVVILQSLSVLLSHQKVITESECTWCYTVLDTFCMKMAVETLLKHESSEWKALSQSRAGSEMSSR